MPERSKIAFRTLAVWAVIIAAESVHGVVRGLVLVPVVGDLRSRQIGVLVGSLLIFAIAYLTIEWIGAERTGRLFAIGAIWAALTAAFEFCFGRLVVGASWERILSDYRFSQGGLMVLGLLFMALCPYAATRLKDARTLPAQPL